MLIRQARKSEDDGPFVVRYVPAGWRLQTELTEQRHQVSHVQTVSPVSAVVCIRNMDTVDSRRCETPGLPYDEPEPDTRHLPVGFPKERSQLINPFIASCSKLLLFEKSSAILV